MYQVHSTNVVTISELLRVSQNYNLDIQDLQKMLETLLFRRLGVPSFICVGSGASQTGILRNC